MSRRGIIKHSLLFAFLVIIAPNQIHAQESPHSTIKTNSTIEIGKVLLDPSNELNANQLSDELPLILTLSFEGIHSITDLSWINPGISPKESEFSAGLQFNISSDDFQLFSGLVGSERGTWALLGFKFADSPDSSIDLFALTENSDSYSVGARYTIVSGTEAPPLEGKPWLEIPKIRPTFTPSGQPGSESDGEEKAN